MKPITKISAVLTAFCVFAVGHAAAATEHWIGPTTDSNWTTAANWSTPQQTFFNNADFMDNGGHTNLNDVSVDSIFTSATGVAQMPMFQLRMQPTNRNFTILINPGVKLYTGAGAGDLWAGGDTIMASRGLPNIQETVTFTGTGGTLGVTGTLHVGQGLSDAQTTPPSTNYITLNLSGLDNFVMNPSYNGASGTAASRFLLCGQIHSYSQGAIYLAKTNNLVIGNDMEIGAMSTFSNSMPCPVYLGISNSIMVGNNGVANGNVTIGSRGNTNAFIVFNPAFLGGANAPTATFGSTVNGGRVNNFFICNATGGVIPAYGYADFSGGNVSILASNMFIGVAGTNIINALGVLTADNGIINTVNLTNGYQSVTNASAGIGVGIINLRSNATYLSSATLQVNGTLALAAVISGGTLTAGTAGTINVSGGALSAATIVNGPGVGTINVSNGVFTVTNTAGTPAAPISNFSLTNSTLQFAFSATTTNLVVGNLKTHGSPTVVNILSVPAFNSGTLPVQVPLIAYSGSIGDAGYNFILGSLPPLCSGSLVNNSTNHTVDLLLTAAPLALTWTGATSGDWDTTTTNWSSGSPTTYSDNNFVLFPDGPGNTTINLTTTLTPNTITVSNTAPTNYVFQSSGSLAGTEGLIKSGSGTLIIDNSGNNTFSGGITINGGAVQVGNNDANGNLPTGGGIIDNSSLTVARTDTVTIANPISGTGSVTEAGTGGTLTLSGVNSFTNGVLATNGSTLKFGSSTAVGTGSGVVTIASGSTLDLNGFSSGKSIVVSGTGVGGNGAIVDNGGNVLDTAGGIASTITLAGDTTITFPASGHRMDLVPRPAGGHLNSGGQPYNLTIQTADGLQNYMEFWDVVPDASLGNVTLLSGQLGLAGTTQLGDTNKSLILTNTSILQFYNDGANNLQLKKPIIMNDNTTIMNSGGASTLGPITFPGSGYCTFSVSGVSLSLTNTLSGNAIMYVTGGNGTSPLNITGSSPAFTGGVLLYTGPLVLNGSIGSGIASQTGTTISGTGTANGLVNVGGSILAGGAGVAGTLTVGSGGANGLIIGGGVSLTNDCGTNTTVGGGVNDLIAVNGDLTVNNNMIYINPLGGNLATTGEYTLMTYTGNLNGSFAGVALVAPSRYILTLDTNTPHQIKLQVTGGGGGGPASLVWNNAATDGEWNVQSSQNWSNRTSNVSPDYFFTQDSVLFDDSIAAAASPTTAIDIASGQSIIAGGITNNSITNYSINGAGKITGASSLTKLGSSTLTINTTNDFNGIVSVQGGTLVSGSAGALGSSNATVVITNGGTVDMNGFSVGARSNVFAGAGVGNNGALINNGGAIFYNGGNPITNITLTGNTTLGGPNRFDLGTRAGLGLGGSLSTGGNNYKVTLIGNPTTSSNFTYWEWENLNVDTNLGDIEIVSGELGVLTSTLGNPTNTVIIDAGGKMTFWGGSGYAKNFDVKTNGVLYLRQNTPTNTMNITLEGGSGFGSTDTVKTNFGTISLPGGLANVSNFTATCTLAGVISGAGGLDLTSGNSPLILTATNTYTGPTLLTASGVTLALSGNGSISASTNITLVAGATLNASGRSDSTLTLASGQTLAGNGAITGGLIANSGSTVSPGIAAIGTLTVSTGVTLQGTTAMDLGSGTNDIISTPTILYGGTLSLSFTPGTLAAGNTFKLFNASTYSGGSFTITPPTPGSGLAWDISALTNTGTLGVIASAPPSIGSITLSGTSLTLSGNGSAGSTYRVITSTNIMAARTNIAFWTPIYTNTINGGGTFTTSGLTNNPAEKFRYYSIVTP